MVERAPGPPFNNVFLAPSSSATGCCSPTANLRDVSNDGTQCPFANLSTRSCKCFFGTNPRNVTKSWKQQEELPPTNLSSAIPTLLISSKLWQAHIKAFLCAPHKKTGMVFMTSKTFTKLTPSKLLKPWLRAVALRCPFGAPNAHFVWTSALNRGTIPREDPQEREERMKIVAGGQRREGSGGGAVPVGTLLS